MRYYTKKEKQRIEKRFAWYPIQAYHFEEYGGKKNSWCWVWLETVYKIRRSDGPIYYTKESKFSVAT